MTRPYSLAFKQKMIERLTGKNAVSAIELARETGIRQQNLSRWLQEARSLPMWLPPKRVVSGGVSSRTLSCSLPRHVSWSGSLRERSNAGERSRVVTPRIASTKMLPDG